MESADRPTMAGSGERPPAAVQAIITKIPGWADAHDLQIAPLPGAMSLNNTSYLASIGGSRFVLRVASDTAEQIGVRRADELAAIRAAAHAGIAPALSYADERGNLVMAYVEGRHWEPADFHHRANLARISDTLRRLHAIQGVPADGSAERRIARLLTSATALGLALPVSIERYRAQLGAIGAERAQDERFQPGLTHGDLWGNNFLDDGRRLWLIDWEFAGVGDTLFDLATISIAGRYSTEDQRELLRLYGYTRTDDLRHLHMLQYVVFFFEGAWALVQHGRLGSASYDYQAHAARMFERLDTWSI
jgi:thiamine kinase-like enzyme